MASGKKVMVMNTLERAVSTDINRLQSFANKDQAEAIRFLMNVSMGTDDLDAGGVMTQVTTANSPLNAEILGGLTVKPSVGALDVLIDPGMIYLLNPDSAPDDSNYKFVNDPGIPAPGVGFTMGTNSSGQTRIDVIECTNQTNATAETDNRDVFNPATGAFSATTVTKATQGVLQYRIRQGAPGAGYPGTVPGWLPLAVASVPTGTTNNDTITFWDVRPLVADRVNVLANTSRDLSIVERVHATVNTNIFTGQAMCEGWVAASASNQIDAPSVPGRYRLGGRLRTGVPTLDQINVGGGRPDGLDLNAGANQSGTWTAGQPVYVYLMEPFLLPRWARYTDAVTGVRKPRSPRGILVVSPVAPKSFWGCPSAPVTMPALCGFGSVTANKGVCIMALVGGSGQTVQAIAADGKMHSSSVPFAPPLAGIITGSTNLYFPLVEGTHYPANAKSIVVSFSVAWYITGAAGTVSAQIQTVSGSGGYVYSSTPIFGAGGADCSPEGFVFPAAPFNSVYGKTVKIPVLPKYPADITGSTQLQVLWNVVAGSGTITFSNAFAQVIGWEL
jgi:hypothetical protein